jgi:hypothetical protein
MLFVVPSVRKRVTMLVAVCALLALQPLLIATAQITLAWTPSPDPQVTGYRVYFGSSSHAYTNARAAGNVTMFTVSNLIPGTTYFLAATAYYSNGLESDFSTEVSASVSVGNRTPTLNPLENITINENAGLQSVALTGISSGATNESQTLVVTTSSSNPALIAVPAVNYTSPSSTGSITFAPAAYAFGSATITVSVNDGATSNNIVSRSFNVTVNAVNQAPTLNPLADFTISENSGVQTVTLSGITSGAANENQVLTVVAASGNPALIADPTVSYSSPSMTGSIAFSPAAFATGSALITVTVNDGGASNGVITRSFNVTVNAVDQPPAISTITNWVVGSGGTTPPIPFTVTDPETPAASLVVSGGSDNQSLVKDSAIVFSGTGSNRTVTITAGSGQTGIANITLMVSDGVVTANTAFQLNVRARPLPPGKLHVSKN